MITAAGRRVARAAGCFMYSGGSQQAADRFNLDHIWTAVGLICVAGFQYFSKRESRLFCWGTKELQEGQQELSKSPPALLFVC